MRLPEGGPLLTSALKRKKRPSAARDVTAKVSSLETVHLAHEFKPFERFLFLYSKQFILMKGDFIMIYGYARVSSKKQLHATRRLLILLELAKQRCGGQSKNIEARRNLQIDFPCVINKVVVK